MQILRGLVVLGILLLAACGGGGGSSPANSPPVAEFSVGCDGLTCTLTDLSTDSDGSIEAHVWEFGDGGSSTEPNPTHTYADSGTFRVRLTVTDDDGEADTIGRDVTTTLVQTVTYERETAHGSPDRHSRYLLHSDGRFELHDIRGAETVVYQGSWTLHDPDFPWIDLDFDEFSGGECAPPGSGFLWEGIGVPFEISGETYLSISYCGNWYLDDREDGDFLEEGFYTTAADAGTPGPPPSQVGQLAFVRNGQIHLVNTDGTGAIQLSSGPSDADPAWSPDGRQIAFTRSSGAAPGIYVMDADGSNLVRRTTAGLSPAWSPDGQSLAFVCTEREHGLCSIVVAGTADPVLIWPPNPAPRTSSPAWSPDGNLISFTSDYNGYDVFFDIFVVAPDGSGLDALTVPFERAFVNEFYQPAWSPDGQRMAFVSCPWAFEYCSSSVVSVMRADGTGREWLAATNGFARPTWSPDGQVIAFTSSNAIEWIRADGSEGGRILADGHSPAWRP